ncbi:MAG: type II secretion system protein [Candidatus Woesebacteria bacterium]
MRNFFQKYIRKGDESNGFTLIELLVVIAIIGILAVAVLSAINPLEQINKGRDTQLNSDASQLLGATERLYTNANPAAYPWNTAATGFTPASTDPTVAYTFDSTTGTPNWNWVNNLTATQEIKDAFATRLKTSKAFKIMRAAGSGASTYICYYPASNADRKTADVYCKNNGATVNAILSGTCATTDGTAPTVPGTNPICVP